HSCKAYTFASQKRCARGRPIRSSQGLEEPRTFEHSRTLAAWNGRYLCLVCPCFTGVSPPEPGGRFARHWGGLPGCLRIVAAQGQSCQGPGNGKGARAGGETIRYRFHKSFASMTSPPWRVIRWARTLILIPAFRK